MWLVLQQIVVRWRGAFPETAPTAVEMGRRAFESGEDRWFAERWLYDHLSGHEPGPPPKLPADAPRRRGW